MQDETGAISIIASQVHSANHEKVVRVASIIRMQGPLTNTVSDFWKMAWAYKVEIIVMCTRIIESGKVT